ncbi:MAG: hypothetical protein AAF385_15920 [Pseudomonadota bacterium]
MINRRISSKIPSNPLAWPLAICAITNLALVGLSAVLNLHALSTLAVYWMPLLSLLLLIVYSLMAIRIGWIATVGHIGQIYHYERRKQPGFFWFLTGLYLTVSVPAVCYWLFRLLPSL